MAVTGFAVSEAAAAIAAGQLSSEELVRALIESNAVHKELNAFVALDREKAVSDAREADRLRVSGAALGPLHGVPLSLKDNINLAGYATTAGTPALRSFRPEKDAPVFAALRKGGAIAFGKNTMHELAYGVTSNNAVFGVPKNPFDQNRSPGGSSGGSATAVAAGLAPAAIGTDTGGSVRIPAALCGLWGYRPTTGRWPAADIVPISTTRDTPGPITRSPEDLVLLDRVVTGCDVIRAGALKGLRVGIPKQHFWDRADREIVAICRGALDAIEREGAALVDIDVEDLLAPHFASHMEIPLFEGKAALTAFLEDHKIPLSFAEVVGQVDSPDVRQFLDAQVDPATAVTEKAYSDALEIYRPTLIAAYDRVFVGTEIDVIAFPLCGIAAPLFSESEWVTIDGREYPTFPTLTHNTDVGSNAGIPGISVPVGLTSGGLPVGLGLDAALGRDEDLLALALALGPMFPAFEPPMTSGNRRQIAK